MVDAVLPAPGVAHSLLVVGDLRASEAVVPPIAGRAPGALRPALAGLPVQIVAEDHLQVALGHPAAPDRVRVYALLGVAARLGDLVVVLGVLGRQARPPDPRGGRGR